MAAPAYGTSGSWSGGSGTTRSFAVPASVQANDIIVIPMFIDGSTVTISAMPSGFAHAPNSPRTVNAGGGGNHSVDVVWKRATGTDSGTYDFTFSASAYVEGQAHRYTGCITTGSPWDVTAAADGGSTNSTTTPAVSVTTTGPDELLFFAGTDWSGGGWTPPTGFTERTDAGSDVTADDLVQTSAGSSGTVQATCTASDKTGAWLGALIGTTVAGSVPYTPPRAPQVRDPGETWWIQRDLRDANTVGSAANPLPSPLDTASRYPHLYGDWTRPSAWPQQRPVYDQSPFVAVATAIPPPATRAAAVRDPGETWWQQRPGRDPAMLGQPQLENELLGGADTAKHYLEPATHTPRWWMPQQPPRVATAPGLLDTALLESPLLGAGDDLRRHAAAPDYCDRRLVPQQRPYVSDPNLLATAELENELLGGATTALRYLLPATHADRREMPQQRPYISDPSFYPTVAPTDPLTVAWGAGGPLWWLYNTAAAQVDRREVPQQRRYVSDPALLLSALLENELLGSADDLRRRVFAAASWSRPNQPAVRTPAAPGAPDADPLTLTGDTVRRINVAAYADRREAPVQPARWTLYFDAGPGLPPLTLAWGAGGTYWHLYNRPSRSRPFWPLPPVLYVDTTGSFSSPNPELVSRSSGADRTTVTRTRDLVTQSSGRDLEV